jgi:HK97 family phage prohead protease
VDQCSFGFDIVSEETDFSEDGSIHWTIKDVDLYEVSVCTFPAYEATSVQAREHDAENVRKRRIEAWKIKAKEELTHGN